MLVMIMVTSRRHCWTGPGMVGSRQRVGICRRLGGRRLLGHPLVVHPHVTCSLVAARETATADFARKRFLSRVRSHMCGQVVAAAERPSADRAGEWPLSGVDAQMTG